MLVAIFLTIIIVFVILAAIIGVVDFFVSGRGYTGRAGLHFDGKHFSNIGWTKRESYRVESKNGNHGKLRAFFLWILQRKKPKWRKRKWNVPIPQERHHDNHFHITFVGHATVLIQIGGINILTDPVWSYRTSPFSWFGPHRYVNPGIEFKHLPKIDIILLSHNHYDHMDLPTLKELHKRDNPIIYTGLGNSDYLSRHTIKNSIDMDWGDVKQFSDTMNITFVPAQHFSARGIYDRNRTLWGGFVIEIGGRRLYFAGDTGYGMFIDTLKDLYPEGFDVGLLPIGAYKPRWFMADIHTNPEEALRMQVNLKIKTGIGIHWGTFPLADDSQDDPLIDLAIAQEVDTYKNLDFRVGPNGSEWKI